MDGRFKFRVWNTSHGSYWNQDATLFLDADGYLWHNVGEHEDDLTEIDSFVHVIEQCTGLKDKNGKLIYEGDICQHPSGETFTVQWSDDFSGFRAVYKEAEFPTLIYLGDLKGCEVIGDIHQNPELLEDK